jgi:predicted DNA-binding protein (UPF0251 family)
MAGTVDRGKRQTKPPSEIAPGLPQSEVRQASMRLPERQREALELRELKQLSYEEIAAILAVSPSSVAQLISRARINLYDDLRGTVLASVAPPSPECERALPLIAAREDGQLEASSSDAAWLDAHLAGCDRCQLGEEQMREAHVAYRKAPPVAVAPGPLDGAMARPVDRAATDDGGKRRRRMTLAASLIALLLLGGLALAFAGGDRSSPPAVPAAGAAAGQSGRGGESGGRPAEAGKADKGAREQKTTKTKPETVAGTSAGTTPVSAAAAPGITAQGGNGGGAPSDPAPTPNRPPGKAALQPTQPTAAPKVKSKPTASPTPSPQPTASAPASAPPPPTEEQPDRPGRSDEAPGKPANRPPR